MYTLIGKRNRGICLLVLTERKSKLQLIRKLEKKSIKEVVEKVKEILEEYPGSIKSITSDNGSEFMDAESI